MNNPKKARKKKSHKIIPYEADNAKDEQQIATQNLFNMSHFEDENKGNTFLNQANMLNSTSLQQEQKQTNLFSLTKKNIIRFTEKKKKDDPQKSQLQNYMDKQFIQQSKVLLKLYSTMPDQAELKSLKFRNKISPDLKRFKNRNVFNPIKTDTVFVAKSRSTKSNSVQKYKKRLQLLVSPKKKSQQRQFSLLSQSLINKNTKLYTNHKNYFPINNQRATINRSLSPEYDPLRQKFSQYRKIKRLKTLDNVKYDFSNQKRNQPKQQRNISQKQNPKYIESKLSRGQLCNTLYNGNDNPTNTFRKRHTFYRSQNEHKNRINVIKL